MTPAISAVDRAGISYVLHEYRHAQGSAAYGEEAARALALDPARVFKTLVLAVQRRAHIVAIIPVSTRLDLKALAGLAGCKRPVMASPRDAERVTGYLVGGISPLGQKRRLRTWIDESALQFDTIFVSGGRRGLELEVTPQALQRLCTAETAVLGRVS